jgi:hypothetical protein
MNHREGLLTGLLVACDRRMSAGWSRVRALLLAATTLVGCGGTPVLQTSGAAGDGGAGSEDAAIAQCHGVYSCPNAIIGEVMAPNARSAPVASVSADSPCRAALVNGTAEVGVDGPIAQGSTTTCVIHGTLTDGTEVVAALSFRPLGGCCSSLNTAINSPTMFAPVDRKCAAADAGAATAAGSPSNDSGCPAAWSSLNLNGRPADCAQNGLICSYPEGQAECAPDGATLKWWTNSATQGCGETAPSIGAACAVPGLNCQYITGPPPSVSEFVTSYCCDGTRCAWTIEQGNGCPNGNTCGTIKASDYDQSCAVDSDCVLEPEGDFCGSNQCTNCAGAVISAKAQARYEADLATKISTPLTCPCPSGPTAVCNQGKCATASPR